MNDVDYSAYLKAPGCTKQFINFLFIDEAFI